MGGICSRRATVDNLFQEATNVHFDRSKAGKGGYHSSAGTAVKPPPVVGIKEEEKLLKEEGAALKKGDAAAEAPCGTAAAPVAADDVFYDGIPRYTQGLTQKSRSVRKVSASAEICGDSICGSLIEWHVK